MKEKELLHIALAIVILAIVIGVEEILQRNLPALGIAILFAAIIIVINVGCKKLAAHALDSDVESEIWMWSRYGFKPGWRVSREIPTGIILPVFLSVFTLGIVKCMTLLTYEATALKRRAARRFGYYSFTEMTDWHNALIGGAGIAGVLLLSFVVYWLPIQGNEDLARLAAYYAFWNMIPFSKLDGSQIFFGSKVLWTTLAILTIIFAALALVLV